MSLISFRWRFEEFRENTVELMVLAVGIGFVSDLFAFEFTVVLLLTVLILHQRSISLVVGGKNE